MICWSFFNGFWEEEEVGVWLGFGLMKVFWGFIDCMVVLLYEIGMFSVSFLFEFNFLVCILFIGCFVLDFIEFCFFRELCFGVIGFWKLGLVFIIFLLVTDMFCEFIMFFWIWFRGFMYCFRRRTVVIGVGLFRRWFDNSFISISSLV